MSVDVSPDGKTIVFDLLGQLYVIPITGGKAKKISHGDGFFSQPKFGPNGTVVYVSDQTGAENVWVANANGSSMAQITHEDFALFTSPAWTHDGKSILVSRRDAIWKSANLWLYDVATESPRQLTHYPSERARSPEERKSALGATAANNGRYFYFAESLRHVTHDSMLPLWQIMRYEVQTKRSMPVIQAPGSAFRPLLSPDGSKIVFGTRFGTETGLRIQDLSTGETRWLVFPIDRDEQESIGASRDILPGYAFTPDGKDLIVAFGGKIRRISIEDGRFTLVPFHVSVSQLVKRVPRFELRLDDSPRDIRLILDPTQSPDGKSIAFSALARIQVLNSQDAEPRPLTNGSVPEFQPRWSPDGKWLAFVSWTNDGGHIWKSATDGRGEPIRLTTVPAYYYDLAWSPEGSKIVAIRAPRQERLEKLYLGSALTFPNAELFWISAHGGGSANRIIQAVGYTRPHFAETAARVYVTAPEGLISVDWDGSGYRHHLKVEHDSRSARNTFSVNKAVVLSPDGRAALTTIGDRLYRISLDPSEIVAPKPLPVDFDSPSTRVTTVSRVGADYFDWADQGATVTWSLGSTFYRISSSGNQNREDEQHVRLKVDAFQPPTTIVLRGARIISMGATGVVDKGDVIVQRNRIVSVGSAGARSFTADAKVIAAEGMTIIPGLIETHAHFLMHPSILDLTHWNFIAKLAYGVTTVRDPQSTTSTILAYQDLVASGKIPAPRILTTGPGLLSGSALTSLDDAITLVRKYKEQYRTDFIKAYIAGNRRERRWIIDACRLLGMMATTEGASDLKLDLTHAIDGFTGNEHSYGTMPLYHDIVQFLVRSGIYTTPTSMAGYGGPNGSHYFIQNEQLRSSRLERFFPPSHVFRVGRSPSWFRSDQFVFPRQAAAAMTLKRAGGLISLGTDGAGSI
ncbi:MAG: hypothetical protein ACRD8O_14235, partial [Bryobacteraceae bacterium]